MYLQEKALLPWQLIVDGDANDLIT